MPSAPVHDHMAGKETADGLLKCHICNAIGSVCRSCNGSWVDGALGVCTLCNASVNNEERCMSLCDCAASESKGYHLSCITRELKCYPRERMWEGGYFCNFCQNNVQVSVTTKQDSRSSSLDRVVRTWWIVLFEIVLQVALAIQVLRAAPISVLILSLIHAGLVYWRYQAWAGLYQGQAAVSDVELLTTHRVALVLGIVLVLAVQALVVLLTGIFSGDGRLWLLSAVSFAMSVAVDVYQAQHYVELWRQGNDLDVTCVRMGKRSKPSA